MTKVLAISGKSGMGIAASQWKRTIDPGNEGLLIVSAVLDNELTAQLLKEFRANPDEFIQSLMKTFALRGSVKDALARHILDKPNRPWCKAYSWLPFMPRHLTLMIVENSQGVISSITPEQLAMIIEHIPTLERVTLTASNYDPLMHPRFVELVDVLDTEQLNWTLTTTGHLLDGDIISRVLHSWGHVQIRILIDAATTEKYHEINTVDIEPVIQNLTLLKTMRRQADKEDLHLDLVMAGMESNIQELPALMQLAAMVDAQRVKLTHPEKDSHSGDYSQNRKWNDYLADALMLSRQTGVDIDMPDDTVDHFLASCNTVQQAVDASVPDTMPQCIDTLIDQGKICSGFKDIGIDLRGSISPCCHITNEDLGNIYQQPLFENTGYLEARRWNLDGGIFKGCQCAAECTYMQNLRSRPETTRDAETLA